MFDLLKSVSAAGSSYNCYWNVCFFPIQFVYIILYLLIFLGDISHPIDVVKTRLQVSGEGTRNYKALGIGGTVKVIFVEEGMQRLFFSKPQVHYLFIYFPCAGVSAFWKGIGAAWLREASYTSLRLGKLFVSRN